ncbi:MAG: hypothetical protein HY290_33550 [Planctomycetia bacterium]|nr:hypothetical protein [Planctomycetia bacterium]
MALQMQLLDPTATNPAPAAYLRIVQANFSFADRAALITVYAYRDHASRAAGKQPLQAFNVQITPDGRAAVVDPVSGETTSPAEPSFDVLLGELAEPFNAIKTRFYELLRAQSQFAGSENV